MGAPTCAGDAGHRSPVTLPIARTRNVPPVSTVLVGGRAGGRGARGRRGRAGAPGSDDDRLDVVAVTDVVVAELLELPHRRRLLVARCVDPELPEPRFGLLVPEAANPINLNVEAVQLALDRGQLPVES